MNNVVCPKCNSIEVQVYEKEEYTSWIGDLKILRRETGQKKRFKECKCLKCGHVFPYLNQYIRRIISERELTLRIKSGSQVKAIGRSGKIFEGKVIDVFATLKIDCGKFTGIFDDQIITDIKIDPEEAPAFLLDERDIPCGLIWAGSDKVSVATKLKAKLLS